MVHEWYVEQVRAAERSRQRGAGDAQDEGGCGGVRRDASARRSRRCFGPFPEKTPLNAKVTGTVERDAYTIEKVIFESRPGFLVTANLYLPKGANGSARRGRIVRAFR